MYEAEDFNTALLKTNCYRGIVCDLFEGISSKKLSMWKKKKNTSFNPIFPLKDVIFFLNPIVCDSNVVTAVGTIYPFGIFIYF